MDFAGGSVEKAEIVDSRHAAVKIRFPANGMTDENYSVLGKFELAEGALTEANGTPAPACTYARQYIPEEMNRAGGSTFQFGDISIGEAEMQAFKNVTNFGSGLYKTISSAVSGKWGDAFNGAVSFLKLVGIMEPDPAEISNTDLMNEIRTTQEMLNLMGDKLDANIKQTYQNRLYSFETDIGVLDTDCTLIESKLKIAKDDLAAQGIVSETGFTDQEASEYTEKLIAYCEEQERNGNRNFKNFTATMSELETRFKQVAVEAAKTGASSPFYAYDSYWDLYFNFRGQSYFLRAGYYANCQTMLKRAYNLLALYYNIPAYQESYYALTDALNAALKAIGSRNLGRNPADVDLRNAYGNPKVYSPSLKESFLCFYYSNTTGDFNNYVDATIAEYRRRLHGKSVEYDIRSAGLLNAFLYGERVTLDFSKTIGFGFRGRWQDTNAWKVWPFSHYRCFYAYVLATDNSSLYWRCTYDQNPSAPEHSAKIYFFWLGD